MAKWEVGERVGAILSGNAQGMKLLGYGTYQGEEIPPKGIPGGMGDMLHEAGVENPKILLDNGDVVWGCQCWWGSEEKVKTRIEQFKKAAEEKDYEYEIREVRIADCFGDPESSGTDNA
jgi:hypothetical protein